MSQESAEVVRRIFDHLNGGQVEAVVALCDDDFLMDMSDRVFNPDTYTGHAGIRRFYAGVEEAWEDYHWQVEEVRSGSDSVVAMLHCQARSRVGGPGVDWRVAWLWKLRDGRAVFARLYRSQSDALDAAGLSES